MASGNFIGGRVITALDVRSVYAVAVIPALLAFSLYVVNHFYHGRDEAIRKI
jgi:predicted MFS family arabinose efflux permease